MSFHMATSYPKEVEQAKKEQWPVILPVGTMEYHSVHCPYGCDTLVSVGVAEALAKKRDCMLLPPVWYGVASYAVGGPEKNTINMDIDVLEAYIYNILKSLFKSGFTRNICILIFHQTEDFLPTALA
ncbi:MAG: creatininase family protein, partial [Clostridia bacterium]